MQNEVPCHTCGKYKQYCWACCNKYEEWREKLVSGKDESDD